jgi:amino acid adenylation domain-containing protein/FkbH-like protein
MSMSVQQILDEVQKIGGNLRLVGSKLRIRAPRGALNMELKSKIDLLRDELTEHLRQAGADNADDFSGFVKVARPARLPLSFAQERLWFLDQLQPGGSEYNMTALRRFLGAFDVAIFERAVAEVVRRHEVLRTRFESASGEASQVVDPPGGFVLETEDLSSIVGEHGGAHVRQRVQERVQEEGARPFNLARGPLFRVRVLRLRNDDHLALIILHHGICDGWSLRILDSEISAIFAAFSQGKPSPLPELSVQYADYALWQRQRLQGAVLERQLTYWRQKLSAVPPLQLPTDRARPVSQSFNGANAGLSLPAELLTSLEQLASAERTTLFMVLLAAFQVVLARWSGQEDIVVGTPVAGRIHREFEGLIGFFVNTLALRTDLSGNPVFRELLSRVKEVTLEAHEHQEVPFEKLVETLQPVRELSRHPIFQVLFNSQDFDATIPDTRSTSESSDVRGARLDTLTALGGTGAKFDLTLYFRHSAGLRLFAVYNVDLFDRTTIERLLLHYRNVLEAIVADPDARVWALPLLGASERHRLLDEWNATSADFPRDKCLHELFAEQAGRTPDAVAVMFEDRQLTYAELDRRSNQLARHLRDLGIGPESIVGLCLERSLEMVVGLLGILKAGGAYLPLDPDYPPERLAYMLSDARVPVLVTEARLADLVPGHGAQMVRLDSDWREIERHANSAPSNLARPGNLAYVIYTSGSTGKPKGVMVEHRQVINYAFGVVHRLPFEGLRNLAMVQSLAVGSAITVLYPALLFGACLHIIGRHRSLDADACANYFKQHSIDGLKIAPSHLASLIAASKRPAELLPSLVVVAGEPSPSAWADKAASLNPDARIFNHYGATETTIGVLTHAVTSELRTDIPSVPLGKPLPNCQVYVLDRALNPAPPGIVGHIYVAGDNLTRGYLGSAALTAEKFIPNPFGRSGTRIYCTNDLGRRLADGTIQYLGREDNQVKLRGFRIELGEIEAAMLDFSEVRQAVVSTQIISPTERRLIAYVVPERRPSLDVAELRKHLKRLLPEYMLPSAIVVLDALPRTAHGKVDRRALPVPEQERPSVVDYEAPRTPTEEMLAGIWSEILRIERVGVGDGFFALGGHSLLATRVIARVRDGLGVDLPVRTLFESPVLGDLADRVDALMRENQGKRPALVARPRESTPPLSFAQERLWILDQLQPGGNEYNIPIVFGMHGELNVEALKRSVGEIVRRHEVLRTRFEVRDGGPVQVIEAAAEIKLMQVDLSRVAREEREAELQRRLAELKSQPFNLATGPLLRSALLKLSGEDNIVVLVLHHIISDGWSRAILIGELSVLYAAYVEGLPSPLPELKVQYADYARWQRDWLQDEVLERRLKYWRTQLAGAPGALELPADRLRPAVQNFKGATLAFGLSPELSRSLGALAIREGATLFMVLLAAFVVVLERWSGQKDIVVGTPIAGRTRRDDEGLLGFFVNTLAMRTDLSGNPSFRELLDRVKAVALEAYEHQDFPFEKLVQELRPERDLSRQPLFQTMFALQNMPRETLHLPGLDLRLLANEGTTSKFDISLFVSEGPNGLRGWFEYATALFKSTTMETLQKHLEILLEAVVAAPDRRLAELNGLMRPPAVEISVSSTFTGDPVLDPLWFWTERIGLTCRIRSTGYNQVLQSVLADPPLAEEPHQFHLILLRLEDWGRRANARDGSDDREVSIDLNDIERNVEDFVVQLERSASTARGYCLVGICPASPEVLAIRKHALRLQVIEGRLVKACRGMSQVRVLPFDTTAKALRLVTIHDSYLDKIAQIPYSQPFFAAVATSAVRALFEVKPHIYKVLVVDCDNTLWQGICGEDGPLGVTVSHGRRLLQEYLVQLAAKGVLVCLCSRNNESDVIAVFQGNPEMVLSFDEIASHRIGWGSKPVAIAELAAELSLGLDSFVFLDDDPVECARVEAERPEVLTLILPASDEAIAPFLDRLWMFDGAGSTPEDQKRTRLYREERQRREVRGRSGSLQEFIDGLELRINLRMAEPRDIERASQITERTTQFNTTGLRLHSGEVNDLLTSPDHDCVVVEVSDRFGDYGSSGLLVVDRSSDQVWRVTLFALSCRVLGRDVEFGIVRDLVGKATAAGVKDLVLEFHSTARNIPAQLFLRELHRLLDTPQDLRTSNVFRLTDLASALERRVGTEAAESIELTEPDEPPIRPAIVSEFDFKTARRHFCRLAAVEYPTVADIVKAAGASAVRIRPRTTVYEAPRTPKEEMLVAIWEDVLRVKGVGIRENFFELGGHSLLATRMVARFRDSFGIELPLRAIFEAPTVAECGEKILEREELERSNRAASLKSRIASMSPEEVRAALQQMKAADERKRR